MGFVEAVQTCFRKYVDFSGRAMRSEYWWFYLFTIIGSIVFGILDGLFFGGMNGWEPLGTVFSLAVLLPTLSAAARRLHDTDRSGWWQILPLVAVPIGLLSLPFFSGGEPSGLGIGILAIAGIILLVTVILLIVWLATKGTEGPNRFGDDPLGNTADVFD